MRARPINDPIMIPAIAPPESPLEDEATLGLVVEVTEAIPGATTLDPVELMTLVNASLKLEEVRVVTDEDVVEMRVVTSGVELVGAIVTV